MSKISFNEVKQVAQYRWKEILVHFTSATHEQLDGKHHPCPNCDGKDRFRFDDKDGRGTFYCNQCGGSDYTGGAGDGWGLLARCNGWDFKESIAKVSEYLGLNTNPSTKPIPELKANEWNKFYKEKKKEYKDYCPSYVWAWYNEMNKKIGYLIRLEFGKKKIVNQVFWDGARWVIKSHGKNRPLFGIETIKNSQKVLVVEGEKTCCEARKISSHPVLTWVGGAKAPHLSNWKPLKGKTIILFPDNDYEGKKAMYKIAELTKDIAADIKLVELSEDKDEKWDLADAVAEGWGQEDLIEYINANSKNYDETNHKQNSASIMNQKINQVIKPLGVNGENCYYMPKDQGQIITKSISKHNHLNLIGLADLSFWQKNFKDPDGEQMKWVKIASILIQGCKQRGIFNPANIRGRGCWNDKGRIVFHQGNKLFINSEIIDPFDFDSKFIYEKGVPLDVNLIDPLCDEDSKKLIEIVSLANWEHSESAYLLLGWIAMAPVCGYFRWKPHIWLTGSPGTGKSLILNKFLSPLLGDLAIGIMGGTSEAGVRQYIKRDSLPILYDESEPEGQTGKIRNSGLLFLVRTASSESTMKILKGTTSHIAEDFKVSSMFAFSLTIVSLEHQADKSRFTQLSLKSDNNKTNYAKFLRLCDSIITKDYALKFMARSYKLAKVISKNAETFSDLIANKFGSKRFGDQIGFLIAGYESLKHSEHLSIELAQEVLDLLDISPFSESLVSTQEQDLLTIMLQIRIKIDGAYSEELTLGQCISKIRDHRKGLDIKSDSNTIVEKLKSHGIKYNKEEDSAYLAYNSQLIANKLKDTFVPVNWHKVLLRIKEVNSKTAYFGPSFSSNGRDRAIIVPCNLFIIDEEE